MTETKYILKLKCTIPSCKHIIIEFVVIPNFFLQSWNREVIHQTCPAHLRFNNAPTERHSMDVGNKTSIRIVNSQVRKEGIGMLCCWELWGPDTVRMPIVVFVKKSLWQEYLLGPPRSKWRRRYSSDILSALEVLDRLGDSCCPPGGGKATVQVPWIFPVQPVGCPGLGPLRL